MKNKMNKIRKPFMIALTLGIVAILMFTVACGNPRLRIEDPQIDTNFVVRGNGSIAVQYGPYVYFINGTRGSFEDPDADMNRWGDVIQGGLFRTRLNDGEIIENGRRYYHATYTTSQVEDNDALFDFRMVPHTANDERTFRFNRNPHDFRFDNDEYNEEFLLREELFERVDVVENTLIAPKAIGTASGGGLFIFGEFIYFATPNNSRNRQGVVEYGFTDFYRLRITDSRARPQHIFRTRGEATGLPFVFHPVGDRVYLVAAYHNDNDLISIVSVGMRMNDTRRPYRAYYLTQSATDVHMPFRSEFWRNENGVPSITLDDFIFFTRDVVPGEDNQRAGNLIEVKSPCGNEGFSFQETGETTSIEGVGENTIFYTRERNDIQEVMFSNLHNALMEHSSRYQNYQNATGTIRVEQINGIAVQNVGAFSTRVFFRGHRDNHAGYMLGFGSEGVQLISHIDYQFSPFANVMLVQGDADFLFIDNGYLYYEAGGAIFRINIFTMGAEPQLLTDNFVTAGGALHAAVVADHFMFFAQRDEHTPFSTGYAHFINMNRVGSEPFFIGTLHEDHIISDQELLNVLRGLEGGYVNGNG